MVDQVFKIILSQNIFTVLGKKKTALRIQKWFKLYICFYLPYQKLENFKYLIK